MAAPNWIVTPEAIGDVEGQDFERLCYELLDFEVSRRHVGGSVGGPPPKYGKDKGMDIQVKIAAQPRVPKNGFPHALTEDTIGETCVACKSGKNWKQGLTQDAKKKPAPVATVKAGGRFTMLVNQKVGRVDKSEFVSQVAGILAGQLKAADDLSNRVHLFDANDLAAFYAHDALALDPQLRRLLQIPQLEGLYDCDEWASFLERERSLPSFSPDKPRNDAISELREVLNRPYTDAQRAVAVWVYGPPGVGKSRVVFEALRGDDRIRQRVLAASDFGHGKRAVQVSDLPRLSGLVLVIDDCPAHEAESLRATFQARAGGSTVTLILIGPQDEVLKTTEFGGRILQIQPLADEAARQLVEGELGVGDAVEPGIVERVLGLTEGYPWFAVLLTRAVRSDPGILPVGADQLRAAKLAIAGSPDEYGDAQSWEEEALRREKALLAVILTESLDWSALDEDIEQRLGRALGEAWSTIREVAERCWRRGIVRVRQDWRYKYITPNNLARLVASHLLQPPFSIGKQVRQHLPELKADFYRRLEALEVPGALLETLAQDELLPFLYKSSIEPTRELPLQFLAKRQPAAVARFLRRAVEAADIEELTRRTDLRRNIVFALEHISRRKVGFEDAEAALFRLALAENEAYGNNATGVWSSLFLGALSLTHRTFEERLSILFSRVTDGTEEERLVALVGVAKAVSGELVSPGYTAADQIDGPWPGATVGEIQEGKRKAWRVLSDLTLDELPSVAREARAIAIRNLREGLRWGVGSDIFRALARVVDKWTDQDKAELREQLDETREYEGQLLERDSTLREAFESLRRAAQPGDFRSRLLDVVGRWFPGDAPRDMKQRHEHERQLDEELAGDGLALPDAPLAQELAWLDSDKAVRAAFFMQNVGRVDKERVLLKPLVKLAEGGRARNTLPAYLAGLAQAASEAEVDDILRGWRGNAALTLHTLLIIWRIGPSDERIAWIIEDLKSGSLDPDAVGCLALGSWGRRASIDSIRSLVETLAALPSVTPRVTALDLVVERAEGADPSGVTEFEPVLERLVVSLAPERLTQMSAHIWELGCKICLARGLVATALRAAIAAIESPEEYGSDEHGWRVMAEVMRRDAVSAWQEIGALIERREANSYRIALEMQSHGLISLAPPDAVLAWVGSDKHKSLLAALMCNVHTVPLNELTRQLIIRFGPDSPAAHELAARSHSTPQAVTSLAGFMKSQLENARQWAQDPDSRVALWAEKLIEDTEKSYDYHSAQEEFEEREYR